MSESLTTDSRRRQRDEDDDGSDGPPHTRPRLEDATLVEEDADTVVRDPVFYQDDGDCIIRVEDTLFKIHRHLLIHELSAFDGLFSLPSSDGDIEGKDDALPIRLSGDTVEEIRAFLGYAYSSPLDVQYDRIPASEIPALINTAKFTHKYRLDSFEKWALKSITHVCSKQDWALLKICPAEMYVTLLELDALCPLPSVKKAIRSTWVPRLRENDAAVTLAYALNAADGFRFRALQGDVYYLQLQGLVDPASDIPYTEAACPLPDDLSDLQKLRLLMGFRSLSLAWGRISANPIVLDAVTCYDHDYHQRQWEIQWRRTVDRISANSQGGDFLKRFQMLHSSLSREFADPGCPCLAEATTRRLPDLIKTLRKSMADHFLGPEVEALPS